MTLHIVPKDVEWRDSRTPKEVFDHTTEWVNDLLVDKDDGSWEEKEWARVDEFLRFFAERIDRCAIQVDDMRKEWVMNNAIAERDERCRRARVEEGHT